MSLYAALERLAILLLSKRLSKPIQRVTQEADGEFLIGHRLDGTAVVATEDELKRHMLLLGATGCGKTTLILRIFDREVERWR